MKFSVLLPTRNRLDFLKFAITSVLKQNYPNFEIIVSDNASQEDVKGYIQSLNEPRIKYSRTEEFLTVTENWNRCLNQASGDYLIMLGDDDILLQNYFEITKKLIEKFQSPDLIYTNAYLYAYPNVLPDFPKGVFNTFGSLHSMPKKESPFFLDFPSRLEIVQKMLNFQTAFGTNMQHALVHKSLIEKVNRNGNFFYSPYPDFYAMNALFLTSERTLIYPKELVAIGITPKSHGFFFYNNREKEALNFLNIDKELKAISTIEKVLLPAPGSMLSFWLGAWELLRQHFPFEKYNLKLDYQLYRNLQIGFVMGNFLQKKEGSEIVLTELNKRLTFAEKYSLVWPHTTRIAIKKMLPKTAVDACKAVLRIIRNKGPAISPKVEAVGSPIVQATENQYQNALEVFENVIPVDCV